MEGKTGLLQPAPLEIELGDADVSSKAGMGIAWAGGGLIPPRPHLHTPRREGLPLVAERVAYEIEEGYGVRQISEPGGQSLRFTAEGIEHTGSGEWVRFTRDSAGRITQLEAPGRDAGELPL